jgi:hypothetical protein
MKTRWRPRSTHRPAAVAAIVARRKTQPYKDLVDLEASVPGLDRAALEAKKRMIFFQ